MNQQDYKNKQPAVEEEPTIEKDPQEYIEYLNELAIYYAGGYEDE